MGIWEKLGIFLDSLGESQRQLCVKKWPLTGGIATEVASNFVKRKNASEIARNLKPQQQAYWPVLIAKGITIASVSNLQRIATYFQ